MKMASSAILQAVMASSLLICLSIFSAVRGCGQMPPGQERTINFNVNGFTIPAAMAFSDQQRVTAVVPGISKSADAATGLVRRLIMDSVFDVLEQQGRSAGLSDDLISLILNQLTLQINYMPLQCGVAITNLAMPPAWMQDMGNHCFIVGGTVTRLCVMNDCMVNMANNIGPIPQQHLVISGRLTTTNVIMANWSREMWQGVLDRVARRLSSGTFATNFAGVAVTIV